MRIIVFFDLPMQTAKDKREYRLFRKFLVSNGFIMMQKSVYCKLAQNSTVANRIVKNVKDNCPHQGIVQVLRITEKQFSKIELVVGNLKKEIIDSDDNILII